MPPLRAGNDTQTLGVSKFCGSHDRPCTDGIDSYWFFHEDVFVGFYCGVEMYRSEMGGSGDDHEVHAGGDHFFICVESDETHFRWNVDFFLVADSLARSFQSIGKDSSLPFFPPLSLNFFSKPLSRKPDVFPSSPQHTIATFSPSIAKGRGRSKREARALEKS